MNKYFITLPYSYEKYGQATFYIYASDSEEAERLAYNSSNWVCEDYNDSDDSDSNSYDYDAMGIEVEEEDVDEEESIQLSQSEQCLLLPCNFSADIISL